VTPAIADTDDRPIIVGGCHRSGTSLVRRILDAHPAIHCGPEVPFFRDLAGNYADDPVGHLRFLSAARSLLPDEAVLTIVGGAFVTMHAEAARRAGKRRWADKAPENVLYVDAWRRLLGERWVFLHVVRNPLDTVASMAEVGFPRTLPRDTAGRIAFYLRYVEAGLDFVEEHSDRARLVVYEQLATEPTAAIGDLMTWLGEQPDPRQLRFNEAAHKEGLEDPKISRTERVHASSVGRWRHDLTEDAARDVWTATAATWARVDPRGRWPVVPG
jgi:hypothetical protein